MGLFDFLRPSKVRQQVLDSLDVRERKARIAANEFVLRHFDAYNKDRRRDNWYSYSMSGDTESLWQLDRLRSRARLLVDNDPKASGLVHKELTNVIGPKISVQANIPAEVIREMGLSEEEIATLTDTAEEYWREKVARHDSKDLDWRRFRTWFVYQRLMYRHYKVDGGLFVRFIRTQGR